MRQGSLNTTFLKMTILPLLGLGVLIMLFSSSTFKSSMQSEVESGLKNLAVAVLNTYDVAYPGDYSLKVEDEKAIVIMKGDSVISGNYDIIDSIKEKTGIDITVFYEDTRVLTTIVDSEGNRIVGTGAHPMIIKEVYKGREEQFYDNAVVKGVKYFAYYAPLYNENGACVGMISAAKPAEKVNGMIQKSISLIVALAILAMILTCLASLRFTRKIIDIIKDINSFLSSVSSGNLTSRLDEKVLARKDEFGEMGRSTVYMQKSLRELIEQDALTKLYNRRSGEIRIKNVYEKSKKTGQPFAIAIGDIDFFKKINDTYGHEAGDAVLKNVAHILNKNMAGKGFAARWGGEEFLIVYEHATLKIAVEGLCDILNYIGSSEVIYKEQKIKVTMTYGAVEGDCKKELYDLLKEADDKLYYGKENGRNKIIE